MTSLRELVLDKNKIRHVDFGAMVSLFNLRCEDLILAQLVCVSARMRLCVCALLCLQQKGRLLHAKILKTV